MNKACQRFYAMTILFLAVSIGAHAQSIQRFNILWPQLSMTMKFRNPKLSVEKILQVRIIDQASRVQNAVASGYLNYKLANAFVTGPGASWALLPVRKGENRQAWLFQYRFAHLTKSGRFELLKRITHDHLRVMELDQAPRSLLTMQRVRLGGVVSYNCSVNSTVIFSEEIFVYRTGSYFSENRLQCGYSLRLAEKFSLGISYFNRWVAPTSENAPMVLEHALVLNSTFRFNLCK